MRTSPSKKKSRGDIAGIVAIVWEVKRGLEDPGSISGRYNWELLLTQEEHRLVEI